MVKLSIEELTSRSMSVMIWRVASIGCQRFSQRVTTTLLKGVNLTVFFPTAYTRFQNYVTLFQTSTHNSQNCTHKMQNASHLLQNAINTCQNEAFASNGKHFFHNSKCLDIPCKHCCSKSKALWSFIGLYLHFNTMFYSESNLLRGVTSTL